MQYAVIFKVVKMKTFSRKVLIFFIFLLKTKILDTAVLTSTHNLCLEQKYEKIGIPLHTPVLLYISGVDGGIHCTDVFLMVNFAFLTLSSYNINRRRFKPITISLKILEVYNKVNMSCPH